MSTNIYQKINLDRSKWGEACKPEKTSKKRLVKDSAVTSVNEMVMRLMLAGTMDEVQSQHAWYHGDKENVIKNIAKARVAPKYMSDNEIFKLSRETSSNIEEIRKKRKEKIKEDEKAKIEETINQRVYEEVNKKLAEQGVNNAN